MVLSSLVNTVDYTIDISLDKSFIPDGLVSSWSLEGTLSSFTTNKHAESFDLKVYQLECLAAQCSYSYTINDVPTVIEFDLDQATDSEIGREFSYIATNTSNGIQDTNPDFISMTGTD